MAVDMFLKIDGVEGESSDSKHKGEIEIESFSWGVTQTGAAHLVGGGAGAGKAQFQDFSFTSFVSKASPVLFLKCAAGEHIKQAILTARKGGEFIKGEDHFLKLTFTDVLISGYQSTGSQESLPVDSVSLNFAKIEYSYTTQDETGKPGETVTTAWDLRANKRA